MPFIIQCPYEDCGKYMLLEDSVRGTEVKCLICKHTIKLHDPGEDSSPGAVAEHPYAVRTCGQCGANMRIPSEAVGKPVRCPKCEFVTPPDPT